MVYLVDFIWNSSVLIYCNCDMTLLHIVSYISTVSIFLLFISCLSTCDRVRKLCWIMKMSVHWVFIYSNFRRYDMWILYFFSFVPLHYIVVSCLEQLRLCFLCYYLHAYMWAVFCFIFQVFEESCCNLLPNVLCEYLYNLAEIFTKKFYLNCQVYY